MADWRDELGRWLAPFVELLGHKAGRRMCPLYVAGLIGPGDRKSVGPMAERVAPGDYDRLHHFVSDGVWDEAPLEFELTIQADKLVGGADAFLVIDDTALPKKGTHSVGVGPQYASALGKTANCQTLVSLTLARGEVPVMVGLRLFLPESWTGDEARLERAGVPAEYRSARTKSEIALAELDRLIAAGVRFGTVLADAGYGMGAEFRQALSARGLAWAVGIPRHQKVYPRDVELVFPVAGRGRPRKRHVPNVLSISAEDMLAQAKWRTLAWRKGTKGPLKARFAAVRVRVADGPPQRIGDKGMQHMPRRGLARRRAARVRRAEILPGQPSCGRRSQDVGRDDQGALGLRAGSPAAQGRTRPRPLRRPLMARSSSPRADGHHRLRLPPASPPRRREWGKKNRPPARLSRRCPPFDGPSSSPWPALRPIDVPIAADEPGDPSNETAKVGHVDRIKRLRPLLKKSLARGIAM